MVKKTDKETIQAIMKDIVSLFSSVELQEPIILGINLKKLKMITEHVKDSCSWCVFEREDDSEVCSLNNAEMRIIKEYFAIGNRDMCHSKGFIFVYKDK